MMNPASRDNPIINIQVKRSVRLPIEKKLLQQAALATLESENAPAMSEMSIVIGNDALLQQLNHQYRSIDTTTDVLAFPSNDRDPETEVTYLGDIVISLPRAEEQASSEKHSLADELQLLVVHGTLHLLGHDHHQDAETNRMQTAQDKILKSLGVHVNIRL
jgi:probable rRNA maturation factor